MPVKWGTLPHSRAGDHQGRETLWKTIREEKHFHPQNQDLEDSQGPSPLGTRILEPTGSRAGYL